MPLTTIHFPTKDIQLTSIYENKSALDEIKKTSPDQQTPEKVKDVYGPLYFPCSPTYRPYLIGCFVLTLDGKLGFRDYPKSTAISKHYFLDPMGGLADLWIVNLIRTYVDGIVLGPRTLSVEDRITGHIYDQDLQWARKEILQIKNPIPWNILISRTGRNIPLDHPLFSHGAIPKCIVTSFQGYEYLSQKIKAPFLSLGPFIKEMEISQATIADIVHARHHNFVLLVIGEDDAIDPTLQFKALKEMGIHRLSIESPSYFFYLMQEKLLDEAFINYSCLYAGGDLSLGSQHAFTPHHYPGAQLLSIHMHNSHFLYTRQKLQYQ